MFETEDFLFKSLLSLNHLTDFDKLGKKILVLSYIIWAYWPKVEKIPLSSIVKKGYNEKLIIKCGKKIFKNNVSSTLSTLKVISRVMIELDEFLITWFKYFGTVQISFTFLVRWVLDTLFLLLKWDLKIFLPHSMISFPL